MINDDGKRSKNGVVVSLIDEKDTITLVFDDVESHYTEGGSEWNHKVLFTSNTYDKKSFTSLTLSQEQFAEIGENIITRILVLEGRLK